MSISAHGLNNLKTKFADYNSVDSYIAEVGESLAHTYYWLHKFVELGQLQTGLGEITADYPAAMVFVNQGAKKYVVYNFEE